VVSIPNPQEDRRESAAAQDRAREGAQRLAEGESADRGSALDGTGEPRPTHAVVSPDAGSAASDPLDGTKAVSPERTDAYSGPYGSAAYRRPVPPERECRGGCGRKRRTWSESWLCRFCLLADRAASPLSMREWRKQRERDRLAG